MWSAGIVCRNRRAEWTAASQPPGVPTPNWIGLKNAARREETCALAHLDVRRLSVNPMAIGRMPPDDFLFSAIRRPQKNVGATSSGQWPASIKFTKAVNAVMKSDPDSRHCTKSFKCWGRSPSWPPEDPAGNDRTAFRTSDSSTDKGMYCLGSGRDPSFSDACGCFCCIAYSGFPEKEELECPQSTTILSLLWDYHPPVWMWLPELAWW